MNKETQIVTADSADGQLVLGLPPGIVFEKRRLRLPSNLSMEQWTQVARFVKESRQSTDFWTADLISAGVSAFGKEKVADAMRQLEFEQSEFRRAMLLNSLEAREPNLTVEHHFVLAKAKLDAVGTDMWVQLAVEKSLSAAELQESIKLGQVTRIDTGQGGSSAAGVATWQGLSMQFDILRRQIGDTWKDWDAATIDGVLERMGKMLSFAGELAERKRELS